MRKTIGAFEIDIWMGGHPVWIHLSHEDRELKFTHRELRDLKHAIAEAERAARHSLPEQYKSEV